MPKDPVCGMGVEEGKAQYRSQFRGKTYHFCTARCKEFFERNPVRYLRGSEEDLRDSRKVAIVGLRAAFSPSGSCHFPPSLPTAGVS
ncbi:MAG TPA: YHS domain-containing protein [Desulfatiglandales bacterium]|nr:YHS domain-containing protein [Desulfatiglandales bacterium]